MEMLEKGVSVDPTSVVSLVGAGVDRARPPACLFLFALRWRSRGWCRHLGSP